MEATTRQPPMHDAEKANILLVDDLPDKLLVLETVLEELGQNLVVARSGEEALRRVLEQDFAVILLDINMPGMDGLETAAYIRRRKKSAHTPIIFITAYADEVHTAQGYSLGAVDYIFSPVVPDILRSKVKVFVDLFLMHQQVRRQADERVALAREQAARAAAEAATRRSTFLAEAAAVLSSTLDFEATLRGLARLAVPFLADLAAVTRVDEQGRPCQTELVWASGIEEIRSITLDGLEELFPPLRDALGQVLAASRPDVFADLGAWGLAPADHPVALRSTAVLPLVARGRVLGLLTLAQGASERLHDHANLALAEDLAARAAIALDNARLYQNIQEGDRRKNEFLAMLAHELRNPLAPIRNAVHVLKMIGEASPTLLRARDMIDRQVAHMARLIDDLLDMSRLSRGKILLRKERLDLVHLVRETVDDYRSLLELTRLRLRVDLPDAPLWVDGDPTRLSQVLGNILHNAHKFTDPGGEVEVRLSRDGPGHALLSVRDTGIGMDPDMLGRVFETFSQADSSLDRSRGGLGLGLALVKGLVDLHGGEVRAASAGPGRGTLMTVRLPLGSGPAERREAPASVGPLSVSCRVLLIEDNQDAAESLRMLFAMSGHEVRVAHAGPAGVECARAYAPDVIVCDIGLPGGMDGYAVARALRAEPAVRQARLIALSGYGQEEDQRRSREAGFDAHLIKPIDFVELLRLVASLDRRNGAPAPPAASRSPEVGRPG